MSKLTYNKETEQYDFNDGSSWAYIPGQGRVTGTEYVQYYYNQAKENVEYEPNVVDVDTGPYKPPGDDDKDGGGGQDKNKIVESTLKKKLEQTYGTIENFINIFRAT